MSRKTKLRGHRSTGVSDTKLEVARSAAIIRPQQPPREEEQKPEEACKEDAPFSGGTTTIASSPLRPDIDPSAAFRSVLNSTLSNRNGFIDGIITAARSRQSYYNSAAQEAYDRSLDAAGGLINSLGDGAGLTYPGAGVRREAIRNNLSPSAAGDDQTLSTIRSLVGSPESLYGCIPSLRRASWLPEGSNRYVIEVSPTNYHVSTRVSTEALYRLEATERMATDVDSIQNLVAEAEPRVAHVEKIYRTPSVHTERNVRDLSYSIHASPPTGVVVVHGMGSPIQLLARAHSMECNDVEGDVCNFLASRVSGFGRGQVRVVPIVVGGSSLFVVMDGAASGGSGVLYFVDDTIQHITYSAPFSTTAERYEIIGQAVDRLSRRR